MKKSKPALHPPPPEVVKHFSELMKGRPTKVRFEDEIENPFTVPSNFPSAQFYGMPKPGRSVPKFNIKDLPKVSSFDDEIFKSPQADFSPGNIPSSVMNLMEKEIKNKKLSVEKRLNKIKTNRDGLPPPIKPKTVFNRPIYKESKNLDYDLNETFMSNSERIRNELLNVQFGVRKEVQRGIGFGFRKTGAALPFKKPYTPARVEEIFDDEEELEVNEPAPMRSSLLAIQDIPKPEKTVKAMQSKITATNKQSKEPRKVVLRHPSSTDIDAFKISNTDGSKLLPGNFKLPKPLSKAGSFDPPPLKTVHKTKSLVSGKLAELSHHFRESLKVSPKDLQAQNVKSTPPTFDFEKHQEANSIPIEALEERSLLLSRRGKKFTPLNSKVSETKPKSILTKKRTKDNNPDFSGMVELRSLLEKNRPHSEAFNKQAVQTEFVKHPNNQKALGSETQVSAPKKQNKRVSIGTHSGSGIPQEALNQKLEQNVKNMNDVAKVAHSLGTMVTRAAGGHPPKMEKISNTDSSTITAKDIGDKLGLKFDMGSILNAKTPIEQKRQMLKLAEELKSLANNVGTKEKSTSDSESEELSSRKVWKPPSQRKQTFSTLTSPMFNASIQSNPHGTGIQTEVSSGIKSGPHFQIPEIKFTPDMSPEDQKKLQELRKMQHTWQLVERRQDESGTY